MEEYERAAAQRQRQGVIRSKVIGFRGEPRCSIAIGVGSYSEIVGCTLCPTPAGNRLCQSIAGRQLLRTAQLFEGRVALRAFDREGKWQGVQCQADRLIEVVVKSLCRRVFCTLDGR